MDRDLERSLVNPFWCLHWNQTGTARVFLDGRSVALGPDRLLLLPPHSEVRETMREGEQHTYLNFTLGPRFDRVRPGALVLPAGGEVRALCADMARRYRRDPDDAQTVFIAHALIALLLRRVPRDRWDTPRPSRRIAALIEYMHGSFGEPINNRDLSLRAGLATNSMLRLFTREVGQPPRHYLAGIRVEAAARLLQHTDLPIDTIARRCGFCDRNYFSSVFRRRLGAGPATYRRTNAAS
jgi:AraC-like DNA-binding protein